MNKIKKIIFLFRVWNLKRTANRLAKKTGDQYFIVKLAGNISLLSKSDFTSYRQNGIFPKTYTAADLKKAALYHTKK